MQLINGALLLSAKDLFLCLYYPPPPSMTIVPLTTIYASLKSHRSDLSIDILNLICLLGLNVSSALPD